MDKERLTDRNDWKSKPLGRIQSVLFADLFSKYLEKSGNKTCLEIGCMPGGFLAYICKTFGYAAHGIDYAPNAKQITHETLKANGIDQFVFHGEDMVTWKPPMQHDLVCSFGFIEHFTGSLQRELVRKHVELVKPRGRLIIDVPNFNYGQYFLHLILDRRNLMRHNVECMKLSFFKRLAEENKLKIIHLGYYGGLFVFWHENDHMNFIQKTILKVIKKTARRLMRTRFKTSNNRFFSPFLIFIAEKN